MKHAGRDALAELEPVLLADLKEDLVSFKRFRVSTQAEQKAFVARVQRCLRARKEEN